MYHKNHILSDRLKELRKEHNLTQSDIGEILHVSKVQISDIEKGKKTTTIDNLVILAQYFKVSTDYLLGLSDDREHK